LQLARLSAFFDGGPRHPVGTAQTPKISNDVVRIGVLTDLGGPTADVTGPGSVYAAELAIRDFGGKEARKNKPPFSPIGKLACGSKLSITRVRGQHSSDFGGFAGPYRLQAPHIGAVWRLRECRPSGIIGLRAGDLGGARAGKCRWVRILAITAGSTIAAMIFRRRHSLGSVPYRCRYAFQQARPAHARWRAMRTRVIDCVLGCLLRWAGNDRSMQRSVGCEHAIEANQMQPRTGDQCG
jgi:hypothetical protein